MGSIQDEIEEEYRSKITSERRERQDRALDFPNYELTLQKLIALYKKELISAANTSYYMDTRKIKAFSDVIESLESLKIYKQL